MPRYTLCLYSTETLTSLLEQAEIRLAGRDAHFAAECHQVDHRSIVARRAIRDLRSALEAGGRGIDWQRFVERYFEHRYDPSEQPFYLTLHEDGKANLELIRRWIEEHEQASRACSVRGMSGPRLPKVEILIIALALATEES